MHAVGDDLGAHLGVGQNVFQHTALHWYAESLADRGHVAHRTPEVIDVSYAIFERGFHLVPAGIGMTTGHQATSFVRVSVKRRCSGKFRCAGRDANDAGFEVAAIFGRLGSPAHGLVVTPRFAFREVGAIKMHAGDLAARLDVPSVTDFAARRQHRVNLVVCAGAGCGEHGRRSVASMGLAHRLDRVRAAIHHVGTTATMNVNVDKARADVAAFCINDFRGSRNARACGSDVRDSFVSADDDRIGKQAVGQDRSAVEIAKMGHKLQLGWRTAGGDEKYTASEMCSR